MDLLCKIGVDESVLGDVVTRAAMHEIPVLMKKVCVMILIISEMLVHKIYYSI